MHMIPSFKRHALWLTVLSLLGGVVLSGLTAIPASASTKTWNMTTDFAAHPTLNPAPDQYGDSNVWSWMYGTTNTPSSYMLDTLTSPSTYKASCGVKGVYLWGYPISATSSTDPSLTYSKKTIPAGADTCAPRDSFKKDTMYTSPGCTCTDGTDGLDMIVGWASPIKGNVTVSGEIKGIDSEETGVTWELIKGTTVLAGPTNEGSDTASAIGPLSVSVKKGQSLYLEIADGPSGGGVSDELLTKFIITS
jgi:hypothetical protein